jgi:cytochrome c5
MTELMRHMTPESFEGLKAMAVENAKGGDDGSAMRVKNVPQGAATSVWAAAVAPGDLVGGRYCEDCHVADVTAKGGGGVRPYAIDPDRAKKLWAKTEELIGERFPD